MRRQELTNISSNVDWIKVPTNRFDDTNLLTKCKNISKRCSFWNRKIIIIGGM